MPQTENKSMMSIEDSHYEGKKLSERSEYQLRSYSNQHETKDKNDNDLKTPKGLVRMEDTIKTKVSGTKMTKRFE